MAKKDLITLSQAYSRLQGVSGSDGLVQSLITAYSDAVEKWCRRRFLTQAYDELYNGNGDRRLLLRQYPLQSVQSVRYRPVTVVKVGNNTPANVQARVSVTNVGLKFFRSNAGTGYTDTSVTFASYPTLTQLVAAINALGNGWNAQVVGDSNNYGGWPSADLYWPSSYGDPLEGVGIQESQGALGCVNGGGGQAFAELKMHTYELQGFQWDPRGWLLRAIPYTDPELLHPEDLIFPVGINNFRIQYTAGYTTVPEAVQEATGRWVAYAYWEAQRDPALLHQVPTSGATQAWGGGAVGKGNPPADVAVLLRPYRRYTVGIDQG
jgi:hypothetical protein